MTFKRTLRRLSIVPLVAALALAAHWVHGQNKAPNIPPSPALSPQDEMKSFKIAAGYRVELVAAEPLVHDPVAMTFDADGRIWVCEMRGFMPDVDGKREKEPVGTITVLEDTDDDGVMDKRSVFLDQLVLPRALCWTEGGLLVAENGKIWLCRAKNGNLKCNEKKLLFEYNAGNPEHSLNGLMPALDNWIYNAKEGFRLRKLGDKWVRESTVPRGQWGITQDDHGYLVYNVNASLIRGDLVPSYSANAHAVYPLINVALDSDWLDNDERLIRLVLHGLRGPITVNEEPFNPDIAMEMPGASMVLDDRKIAAVLTFVRREWRERAAPIEPQAVTRVRATTKGRTDPWTEKELSQVK